MRNLARNPLTWMLIAELVVVTALVWVAWSVVASAVRPAVASLSLPPAGAAVDGGASSSLPEVTAAGQPAERGPAPGLNVDSVFWRARLDALNRDQVVFEQLEWRITRSAVDAVQRYLETIVLPSLKRAERPGG